MPDRVHYLQQGVEGTLLGVGEVATATGTHVDRVVRLLERDNDVVAAHRGDLIEGVGAGEGLVLFPSRQQIHPFHNGPLYPWRGANLPPCP